MPPRSDRPARPDCVAACTAANVLGVGLPKNWSMVMPPATARLPSASATSRARSGYDRLQSQAQVTPPRRDSAQPSS